MLKLVVCENSSPHGYSKVRNTSLRFFGRELGPILCRKRQIESDLLNVTAKNVIKKIFQTNIDGIFLKYFGFLRTKTFKLRKNSLLNTHVHWSTAKTTISRCELIVDDERWTAKWRRDMRTTTK